MTSASDTTRITVRRPVPGEGGRILEVLTTANFHRIGGREMARFPLADCFVAEIGGRIVGVAGYAVLGETVAKTTLIAVDPAYRRYRVGDRLQWARQNHLKSIGIRELYANCDDERVVAWYCRHFGFRPTGRRIAKLEPFGRADRDCWINLRAEL